MYLSEAIEVENLVKIFVDQKQKREIHACDGLTFSVDRGEIFGFSGSQWCWKDNHRANLGGFVKTDFWVCASFRF